LSQDLWAELVGFDGEADGEARTELTAFDDNIGAVTKGAARVFEKSGDMQLEWSLRVDEAIPTNTGGFVTLKYPAKPRGVRWDKDSSSMVTLTEPADLEADKKGWMEGLKRILRVLDLPAPTSEQMSNEFTASAWAAQAVGKKLVFACKVKNGFAEVKVFPKPGGKMAVCISKLEDESKPGLTRADLARHAIQKASEK